MLIINFEGREVKGLSKGRYDETFAGEDAGLEDIFQIISSLNYREVDIKIYNPQNDYHFIILSNICFGA